MTLNFTDVWPGFWQKYSTTEHKHDQLYKTVQATDCCVFYPLSLSQFLSFERNPCKRTQCNHKNRETSVFVFQYVYKLLYGFDNVKRKIINNRRERNCQNIKILWKKYLSYIYYKLVVSCLAKTIDKNEFLLVHSHFSPSFISRN